MKAKEDLLKILCKLLGGFSGVDHIDAKVVKHPLFAMQKYKPKPVTAINLKDPNCVVVLQPWYKNPSGRTIVNADLKLLKIFFFWSLQDV